MTKVFYPQCGGLMFVAGTRPEMIKIAPVVRQLVTGRGPRVTLVSTSQQADLLPDFLGLLGTGIDYQLDVMSAGQTLNALLARAVAALDPVIAEVEPALVVVQGDTTSALAGAMAAAMRGVPVAHIEAGLRSGDAANPFPEETNRKLIGQLAALHCAPTRRNRESLLREGVAPEDIVVTGNPVVASLQDTLKQNGDCPRVDALLARLEGLKPIVLTTHRRESHGARLERNLRSLRDFVAAQPDTALVMPVHFNPCVRESVENVLAGGERIHLIEPLDYPCFLRLLQAAWLIVSDSGGVQEEVPSLGKPLLVLRSVTERPEAVEAGTARLVGERPGQLEDTLRDRGALERWIASVRPTANPFGDAESPARIAGALCDFVAAEAPSLSAVT
ncbi:MAG: UDP-N-acetylglucosamine 2-epimerase (non-hydrolyzing) [Kiloniellaceae bacterium]